MNKHQERWPLMEVCSKTVFKVLLYYCYGMPRCSRSSCSTWEGREECDLNLHLRNLHLALKHTRACQKQNKEGFKLYVLVLRRDGRRRDGGLVKKKLQMALVPHCLHGNTGGKKEEEEEEEVNTISNASLAKALHDLHHTRKKNRTEKKGGQRNVFLNFAPILFFCNKYFIR